MQKLLTLPLACAALLALQETGYAHGGQYRGPEDIVPPGTGPNGSPRTPGRGGSRGPRTGSPGMPQPPSIPGPPTGRGGSRGGGGNPVTGGGGAPIGDDLARWQYWWEFNKDPFLKLKDRLHQMRPTSGSDEFFIGGTTRPESRDTLRPSQTQINDEIIPALKRALDATEQRDITSSCMIALAKIGRDHDKFKILTVFRSRLKSRDQEIRETAALAMGISQMPAAVKDLAALASDSDHGRDLCDRSEVDDRTRAFAAYALGLIAHATNSTDVKNEVVDTLIGQFESARGNRNREVALINALRLVRPAAQGGPKERALHAKCVDALWSLYTQKRGKGQQLIQAHVPIALAQLVGRDGKDAPRFKEAFKNELTGALRRNIAVYQSAALGLGLLAQPREVDSDDGQYSDVLIRYYQSGKDQQTRYFCLMGLSEIGGQSNRTALMKAYAKGQKALEKPWAAMALGNLTHTAYEAAGDSMRVDNALGEMFAKDIVKVKNPEAQAALAIALGLVRHQASEDTLSSLIDRYKHKDELVGYLTIGLALMRAERARPKIHEVVERSVRRPDVLKQSAVALGVLGDNSVTETLLRILEEDERNVAKLSAVATALTFIGDRRTVTPLIKLLHDETQPDLSRAFAAVALGGVADKEKMPWNSKIAVDMNYRAAVETLTNQVTGILDIL